MRRSALAVGLVLLLLGVFLLDQGSQVLTPLATELGQTSHLRTMSVLIPPTLVGVAPANYTWISIHINDEAQVAGSLQVGTGREINFYAMNQSSFYDWRAGRPAASIDAKFSTGLYRFNLTLSSGGEYYFIFENEENTRRTVIFELSKVNDVIVVHPAVEYLPLALTVVGILLFIWGARSGRKKPQPVEEAIAQPVAPTVAGWKCRFCGTGNPVGETFCQGCGRSEQ